MLGIVPHLVTDVAALLKAKKIIRFLAVDSVPGYAAFKNDVVARASQEEDAPALKFMSCSGAHAGVADVVDRSTLPKNYADVLVCSTPGQYPDLMSRGYTAVVDAAV